MRDEEWLSVQDVAKMFAINEETVRRWIRAGKLPVLPLGENYRSGYRIRRQDVQAFIDANYRTVKEQD